MTATCLGGQGRKRHTREQEHCPREVTPGLAEEARDHAIAMV
jgi:hypothetical protein